MAAPDIAAPDGEASGVANPGVSGVVLVVEDDTAVREAVDRGLTVHGFRVRSVGDAEQAQRSVARDVPAVMVVDVGLPGMSGIELCARRCGRTRSTCRS
jgi:DNA-binding response OmpR family regulator